MESVRSKELFQPIAARHKTWQSLGDTYTQDNDGTWFNAGAVWADFPNCKIACMLPQSLLRDPHEMNIIVAYDNFDVVMTAIGADAPLTSVVIPGCNERSDMDTSSLIKIRETSYSDTAKAVC